MSAGGTKLGRLAALEEERRFLLRSLTDLQREHDAGDVDDLDYQTLKDGYTFRAARVLRQIEHGRGGLPASTPRRWSRAVAVAAAVVVGAVGVGFVLAGAWGERSSGQEITGLTPGDESRVVLTNARDAMGAGDFPTANALFAEVIDMERAQGRESAEAVAYFGWTLALLTRQNPDQSNAAERFDAAVLALGRATEIEPDYADPQCFLAIVEFQFRSDAAAALPHIEKCEASNPPADVASMVANFAAEIRAAN
jgi:tetratricopeptide (TPR) repeat protein